MLTEKRRLDISSKNEDKYSLPFSVTKLKQSLQGANDSATGFGPGLLSTFNPPSKFCFICSLKSM